MDNPMDFNAFTQNPDDPDLYERVYEGGHLAELVYFRFSGEWLAVVDAEDLGTYSNTDLAVGAIEQSVAARLELEPKGGEWL